MATHKLPTTDKGLAAWIQNLKPGPEREWIALGNGLALVVETSGAKTFQARFRLTGSKQAKRMVLGHYPHMQLAEARTKLVAVKAAAKSGEDPGLQAKRTEAGTDAPATVDQLAEKYLRLREGTVAPKTLKGEREQLAVLRAALGTRRLVDLAPFDIRAAVDDYAKALRKAGGRGTNANKVLAVTARMFKMAPGWGLPVTGNPAANLKRPVSEEQKRDRVLWDGVVLLDPARPKLNEAGLFVASLLEEGSRVWAERGTRVALVLSLLLGFRAAEVTGLRWADIRLEGEDSTVTVAKSKTAAGRRTLPLPPFALSLLRDLRDKAARDAVYVFPAGHTVAATRETPRTAHMHPESLSRAMARAAGVLGIEDITHHDLRRTCVSGLSELGFEGIAPRIAGHVAKDVTGRHYDRSRRLAQMRAALVAWEAAVLDALTRHRVARAEAAGETVPEDRVVALRGVQA